MRANPALRVPHTDTPETLHPPSGTDTLIHLQAAPTTMTATMTTLKLMMTMMKCRSSAPRCAPHQQQEHQQQQALPPQHPMTPPQPVQPQQPVPPQLPALPQEPVLPQALAQPPPPLPLYAPPFAHLHMWAQMLDMLRRAPVVPSTHGPHGQHPLGPSAPAAPIAGAAASAGVVHVLQWGMFSCGFTYLISMPCVHCTVPSAIHCHSKPPLRSGVAMQVPVQLRGPGACLFSRELTGHLLRHCQVPLLLPGAPVPSVVQPAGRIHHRFPPQQHRVAIMTLARAVAQAVWPPSRHAAPAAVWQEGAAVASSSTINLTSKTPVSNNNNNNVTRA